VLVTPRDGRHYQKLLYHDIEEAGVRIYYAAGPTPSQTLNIFLAPTVLIWFRIRGVRILHIHWLFQFSLPWARRRRWALRLMQWWYVIYLQVAQRLGYAIVWTAHDILPHDQIFADDRRARDLLISKASVIIALSEATASQLRDLGASRIRVTPMGSYADPYPISHTRDQARQSFQLNDDVLLLSLIGRVEPYKGVDLLLNAVAQLPDASRIKVLIAGLCTDSGYRKELVKLSNILGERAIVNFEWISDDDLARYFQATDVAIFPFREITNSASVLLAQSFGVPVVIPDLPALSDIPRESAIRFNAESQTVLDAIHHVETLTPLELTQLSEAGLLWATHSDWKQVAQETIDAYLSASSS
jgi:glycosyltransferase involved in cell wall biosynthesis